MALTVVYGSKVVSEQDLRLISERGSSETDAVKEDIKMHRIRRKEELQKYKDQRRVVIFGKGTFGTADVALDRAKVF